MTGLVVRVLGWLVAIAAGPGARTAVIADLDEEFAQRTRDADSGAALRWYISQAMRSLLPLAMRRTDPFMSQMRSLIRLDRLRPQVTQAMRSLRRAPAFTLVSVATLTLGIGVSTAAFTAVSAALLQPLPYPTHDRLAVLAETRGTSEISVSYPDFLDWRDRAQSFDALAAFRGYTGTLTGSGAAERIRGQVVTSDLFAVVGIQPGLGRAFTNDDDRAGAPATVLLGDGLWRRRFGADPAIVGASIHIDGAPFVVVGVMPPGFRFPDGIVYFAPDLYLPLGVFADTDLATRGSHPGLEVIGLRRAGVSLERARDEMTRLQQQIAIEHPDTNRNVGVSVADAVTVLVGDLGGQLTTVFCASLMLLLIACANVAGLTLTRSVSRRRELSVRTALGGSRAALALTLLVEQFTVATLGTIGGITLAYGLTRIARQDLADLPRLADLHPDARALACAVVLTGVTSLLCSVAPIFWLSRASLDPWLRERGQSRSGWRFRRVLVGAQVALALTLVACAGLLGESLGHLERRTGGIVPNGVLTFDLAPPEQTYPREALAAFYEDLYGKLATAPGVSAVGGISTLPFSGSGAQSGIRPRAGSQSDEIRTDVAVVTRDYFRAMGIALLRGRVFDGRDASPSHSGVAVVDERFAQRVWPDLNPVGAHLSGWGLDDLEVIGVVAHVDNYGVGHESREELYVPFASRPASRLFTLIRSTADPSTLATFVRQTVGTIDASLAVANVQTMGVVVQRTVAGQRLAALLSRGFGTLAILLAGVGIYGLVAYAVELRRREAGIRLALGAEPGSVVRLMAVGVSVALAIGAAAGVAGALAGGALLRSQLFDIGPYDPLVLAESTAALALTAVIATWIPARRVARISPAITLQVE